MKDFDPATHSCWISNSSNGLSPWLAANLRRGGRVDHALLTEEVVKRKLVPRVGREMIQVLLESHDVKPWR